MYRGVGILRSATRGPRTMPRLGAVRGYADAAGKPPIQMYGLDGTYASALYTASVKASSVAATEKSLKALNELIKSDPKTGTYLLDPSLGPADKKVVIDEVTKVVGGDKVFSGFLEVLSENNRLSLLEEVIADFEKLSDADQGLVEATVTSAKPLDASSLKRISSAIQGSKFVGKDKKLKLSTIVRPEIRGGLIVAVGDRTVDLSVSSKLQKYNQLLSEAV